MDVINETDKIVKYYYENSDGIPLDYLIQMQDKLSGLSYFLAEISAKAKLTYNKGYLKRKIVVNRQTQAILDQKLETAISKAQNKAETMNEDLLEQELVSEALAYEYELKLKQVNKVLQAMQQRISHAKEEWKLNKFQQPNEV